MSGVPDSPTSGPYDIASGEVAVYQLELKLNEAVAATGTLDSRLCLLSKRFAGPLIPRNSALR